METPIEDSQKGINPRAWPSGQKPNLEDLVQYINAQDRRKLDPLEMRLAKALLNYTVVLHETNLGFAGTVKAPIRDYMLEFYPHCKYLFEE